MLIDLHAHQLTKGMFNQHEKWGPFWEDGALRIGDWKLGTKRDAPPLDEFLDETMRILAAQPEVEEVLVDRVRFLRDAEAEGRHADVLALLGSRH